ncbi:putative ORfan [Saudi moumouvirus]|nr:putative ORfan [Saudi moumouvirus]
MNEPSLPLSINIVLESFAVPNIEDPWPLLIILIVLPFVAEAAICDDGEFAIMLLPLVENPIIKDPVLPGVVCINELSLALPITKLLSDDVDIKDEFEEIPFAVDPAELVSIRPLDVAYPNASDPIAPDKVTITEFIPTPATLEPGAKAPNAEPSA